MGPGKILIRLSFSTIKSNVQPYCMEDYIWNIDSREYEQIMIVVNQQQIAASSCRYNWWTCSRVRKTTWKTILRQPQTQRCFYEPRHTDCSSTPSSILRTTWEVEGLLQFSRSGFQGSTWTISKGMHIAQFTWITVSSMDFSTMADTILQTRRSTSTPWMIQAYRQASLKIIITLWRRKMTKPLRGLMQDKDCTQKGSLLESIMSSDRMLKYEEVKFGELCWLIACSSLQSI